MQSPVFRASCMTLFISLALNQANAQPASEEIEVIDEEVVKDKLPLEVPEIKVVSEDSFSANKSQIALKKSIDKKNEEKKNEDDNSQTKLF